MSSFSGQEVDVGLAADIGTLARLPKVVGNQSMARELAYTARNFSAAEAEKMGLVSKVVPGGRDEVVNAALETASVIASKSPIAVVGTKHLLLHARDHRWVQLRFFLYSELMTTCTCQCSEQPGLYSHLERYHGADSGESRITTSMVLIRSVFTRKDMAEAAKAGKLKQQPIFSSLAKLPSKL